MKRILLIFLIFAGTITAHAQDAKPTKEQTIQYLKNLLENSGYTEYNNCRHSTEALTFSGCTLIIETLTNCHDGKYQNKTVYTVDFSQIEKVDGEGSVTKDFIRLTAKTNSKIIPKKYSRQSGSDEHIVSNSLESEARIVVMFEKEKVTQAFNHLRKLCGGPEPIKF